ncbi:MULTISPECIES: Cof-type HAD-IIB family hydrolase [Bacillaceae]|uniref:Cof-type HAD-IIB family hydrolase n=1 Tax=Bacillaceae TaxID=186817 RepID=UPI001E34CAC1|nr:MULTISPECIES: Cof-type HAD-IIB family hydrolase [Bacillaceae]MCE4049061.1 Cof-type HAD-IIB family hydrolase [Bacillus sp. Au-Bac7]UPO90499.1 Cof-type HAD-IIB family hydrolase [Niallia sp. Man26]
MQKIIFLDIDGTLVDDNGIIPDSAKLAVRKARSNGHFVFLCTGRSKSILFPEVLEIGFDGIVGAAGGYIELNGEVLFHEVIKKNNLQLVVDYFNQHEIEFFLETNEGLFASKSCKDSIRALIDTVFETQTAQAELRKSMQSFYNSISEAEDLVRDDINKIGFLGSAVPIERIMEQFPSVFTVIPSTVPFFGTNSGEVSIFGIHKASAIEKVIEHLGLEKEHTYAYGDGSNDIEMLEFVQYGVAMGNAKEEVKRAANDITDRHDEDGIYNSFKKYGLI